MALGRKTGGRKKGTPNRVTREVKEFLAELVSREDVQNAIAKRTLEGETAAFFRALDKIIPDAPKTTNANVNVSATLILDHDIAED